jgi:hypothetical protein
MKLSKPLREDEEAGAEEEEKVLDYRSEVNPNANTREYVQ